MALVTISGYPCSGKSRRADQIKQHLEARLDAQEYAGPKLKVVILSDDTLNIDRTSYSDSRSEKPARGTLFTAMQRQMGQDTILIVDSLNYIKGFRYQMYCAAREHKLRVCTVWVVAKKEMCEEWNSSRSSGRAYNPETLENLFLRYEEPSSMVRWDSPLVTITWEDQDVPAEDIWQAVTGGVVKPPNTGTQAVPKAPTDALLTLEHTTAAVISSIISEQSILQGIGGTITLALSTPTLRPKVTLPARNVTLSEMQRLKRQFVTVHKKAITLGSTEKGGVDWSEESVADKFATYLTENIKS
ncbi:chromatin associated protein KTI12 [Coniophora puteana RWD-64-598 SS2]|uniref:Chromatin associated protein KTI12 n=1 Tax=Coniophora puteana (strain RWD-64-598) TaxID=741705 RepID=A0A5M3MVD5_CONPW|nr:chromatin associated protein KTI12 [Coniophora puteana RWD-64-598 SS2]EIW83086.1 chromatin associated protein KTI12 [Coniophora puteana RWD-64-598 SS2]